MNGGTIRLHHLVGRVVHGVDGRKLGRIEELSAEIELHAHGNEYVVREFHVGPLGALESLAGCRMARQLARVLRLRRREPYIIPWEQMDLTDPQNPRVTVPATQLGR